MSLTPFLSSKVITPLFHQRTGNYWMIGKDHPEIVWKIKKAIKYGNYLKLLSTTDCFMECLEQLLKINLHLLKGFVRFGRTV